MALPIRWSHKAARQPESIIEYIGEDSPRYAAIFAKRVVQTIRVIPEIPLAGRMVPEYGDSRLRERILQGYRIVYRISPHAIEVVTICHGSRLLQNAIEEPDN